MSGTAVDIDSAVEVGRATLAGARALDVHVQPIVDLKRGTVVGHEALSRFGGGHRPDVVFRAADQAGFGQELELFVLHAVLARRPDMPVGTFLSCNLSPAALRHPDLHGILRAAAPLAGVVIEVTEHERIDVEALAGVIGLIHRLGGLFAVDDVGAGYAGLQAVLGLRPDLLKIDRSLVSGMDTDPIKQETVRMLGELAGRLDAWVLVEGVESTGELTRAMQLGVPLAQGWALGRPGPTFATSTPSAAADALRMQTQRLEEKHTVGSLLVSCNVVAPGEQPGEDGRATVVLGPTGRPAVLVPPLGTGPEDHAPLLVQRDERITAVAERLAVETGRTRYCFVVTEPDGTVAGVVPLRVLLGALVDRG